MIQIGRPRRSCVRSAKTTTSATQAHSPDAREKLATTAAAAAQVTPSQAGRRSGHSDRITAAEIAARLLRNQAICQPQSQFSHCWGEKIIQEKKMAATA